LTVINTYEVEPTADGAHIRHAVEVSGPPVTRDADADGLEGWVRPIASPPTTVRLTPAIAGLPAKPGWNSALEGIHEGVPKATQIRE
jgi:hypothetical protein